MCVCVSHECKVQILYMNVLCNNQGQEFKLKLMSIINCAQEYYVS